MNEWQMRKWIPVAVALAMLTPVLLSLHLAGELPFHHDEALYATWARLIASGQNVWLAETPIDKPPLFLYVLAVALRLFGPTEAAARLPSMLATMATVGLTFWLGRRLYGRGAGLLAAWLTALSPFTILFAPTALTDPLLTALALAGCVAAAAGRMGWAGLWLGLAIAAKQQGVFFAPLVLVLGLARDRDTEMPGRRVAGMLRDAVRFSIGVAVILGPVSGWDAVRNQSPGFWRLSVVNYGGLSLETATIRERWQGFLNLLRYAAGSPLLAGLFAGGLPLLLGYALWRLFRARGRSNLLWPPGPGRPQGELYDLLLTLYSAGFLLGHVLFSFQVWDRYLLGLIPLLALLLARILLLPWTVALNSGWLVRPPRRQAGAAGACIGLALFLAWTMARPVQDTFYARYPIGSHSQALSGIEQTAAYLRGNVGANTTLFHRWLGTHWRFYLWDYPYDLQYWESPQDLASRARAGHLIAFPSWQSDTEARLALASAGLTLREIHRAYNPAGYPSIVLYRIERLGDQEIGGERGGRY